MPTVFSHAIIGLAAGALFQHCGFVSRSEEGSALVHPSWRQELQAGRIPLKMRFIGLSILCATLPDVDVAGFALNIPYGHAFGHRGFFHSLFFALVVALFTVKMFFPRPSYFSSTWWLLGSYFFVLAASHGLMDTLTSGGLGIALLAPFDNSRYLAPISLFQAAPLHLAGLLTSWGFRCIRAEFVMIWIPALVVIFLSRRQTALHEASHVNKLSGKGRF